MAFKNAHTAYYLKYRPQSLDDLIGQDSVKQILLSAFQNQKLSHAYLFVGPRGTGKTSTARILAKMVNCELVHSSELVVGSKDKESTNYELRTHNLPCNKCDACLSITDGSNLDLIEIDAASNRGIEDIRSLKETIKLSPSGKGKKVYIIDEVHMLTTEAFNALLKTLEEPPAHALFVLATTDVAKVPQTIKSRVQRLDFNLAAQTELKKALEKIIKGEKIDIDDEALDLIVKKADGSFRDAVKLLDQFSAFGKIFAKDVLISLKTSGFEEMTGLLKKFNAGDAPGSLLDISGMLKNGAEVKEIMLSLMDLLRDFVFIKNGLGSQLVEDKYTSDKYNLLIELEGRFSSKDLIKNLNILQESLTKLKFASIQSLPLELAVVEMCEESSKLEEVVNSEPTKKLDVGNEKLDNEVGSSKLEDLTPSDDILKLKEKWNFVLETVKPYNFSLEALLRSVNVSSCDEGSVIIEVPYSFHQRILEAPKNRDILESILSEILGRQVRVVTVLGNRPARKEDIANVEVAADDEIIRVAAEIFNSEPVN